MKNTSKFLALIIILLCVSAISYSSFAQQNLIEYKVQKSEGIITIAKAHNMDLEKFLEINNLKIDNTIYPDQVLKVYEKVESAVTTPQTQNSGSLNTLKKMNIELVASILILILFLVAVFFSIIKKKEGSSKQEINQLRKLEEELAKDEMKLDTIRKIILSQ
ncbi:LysM domain-containing protein [Flammeovirgaceae bacterium SG7u.111]|nr:LysM domain-containing protein [Flammeovirgaceae bacterium SG7u.132]WPO38746.1 LysM domain-containing protein [Flammeovirgaceae bacterium SG7u.111]